MTNWNEFWEKNDTPFHLSTVNPRLEKFFPQLTLEGNETILVPLCGKSVDLMWLANKGFSVIGVELSPIACEAFFKEQKLTFSKKQLGNFICYQGDSISIYCGDIFNLQKQQLPPISLIYDRAALIALPPEIRKKYTQHLSEFLKTGMQILLLCIESTDNFVGPPYAVSKDEITMLYQNFQITELSRESEKSIEPHLIEKGYRKMETVVYLLTKD